MRIYFPLHATSCWSPLFSCTKHLGIVGALFSEFRIRYELNIDDFQDELARLAPLFEGSDGSNDVGSHNGDDGSQDDGSDNNDERSQDDGYDDDGGGDQDAVDMSRQANVSVAATLDALQQTAEEKVSRQMMNLIINDELIRDSGIGMTRQELVDCLGTIAQSGTAKFLKALKVNEILEKKVQPYLQNVLPRPIVVQSQANQDQKDYLGLNSTRLDFKCPRCAAELVIKTDPQNSDYVVESGATRNFEPRRCEKKRKRENEEMGKAVMFLENRNLDSKREIDILAALDEVKSTKVIQVTPIYEILTG